MAREEAIQLVGKVLTIGLIEDGLNQTE